MIAINKISKFAARRHKTANEEISIVEIFSLINKIKSFFSLISDLIFFATFLLVLFIYVFARITAIIIIANIAPIKPCSLYVPHAAYNKAATKINRSIYGIAILSFIND